ncbi:Acid phosphatase [Aphelenchoides bicaudatus]|nr:Acid phosphatase [Aphelenchoides bicaudatus]
MRQPIVFVLLFVGALFARPVFENTIDGDKEVASEDELVLVHTIWRHGSRAPLRLFKNDPNIEEKWQFGLGNLLPAGMLDCLKLGRRLRERYYDYLSPHYNFSEIFIRSSDTNRTLRSASSNLIGLYEKGSRRGVDYPDIEGWPVGFVPIPVHSIKQEDDDALFGYTVDNCPRFKEAWKQIIQTPEYTDMLTKYQDTIKEGEQVSGDKMNLIDRDSAYYIVDEHFIEKRAKMPTTPGYTDQLYDSLKELNDLQIAYQFGLKLKPQNDVDFHLEMARPMGSALLFEIIDRMQLKAHCYEQQTINSSNAECSWINKLKYFGYSAHDSTISSLFSTFGFKETNWNKPGYPDYTSSLMFELKRNAQTNEFYLQVFYLVADEPVVELTGDIQGCEQSCTLAEFTQRSEIYKIENRTEVSLLYPTKYLNLLISVL